MERVNHATVQENPSQGVGWVGTTGEGGSAKGEQNTHGPGRGEGVTYPLHRNTTFSPQYPYPSQNSDTAN